MIDYKCKQNQEQKQKHVEVRKNKGLFLTLALLFLYATVVQVTRNSNPQAPLFQRLLLDVQTSSINHDRDHDSVPSSQRQLRASEEASLSHLSQLSPIVLQENSKQQQTEEPIHPRNKICRDYLKRFLEGTTDTKDECQGLENAYSAADCSEENTANTMTMIQDQPGPASDDDPPDSKTDDTPDSKTDDTPAIDDFFEEFQCCKVISHYYSSRCLYHQQFASLSLLGIVAVLILCSLVKSALHTFQLNWLPEAAGCILVGAVVGAVLTTQFKDFQMNLGTFNDDLFLYILLPPIIFHASLSIDKGKFKKFLFPIIMFAVVGTVISAIISGFTVHYLSRVIGSVTTTIPILDSMIFGALISSIDPVAVLSIMHSMGVSDTNMLYVVVFGEAILNDGVSIAMFESLVMHLDGSNKLGTLNGELIWSSARYFWKVSWVSIVIGLAVGITCTIYFWCLRGRHGPVSEVASFFCFAMLAYYVSDSSGGSGIVSIMVSGILMDVYVRGSHLTEGDMAHEFSQVPQEDNSQSQLAYSNMEQGAGHPLPPSCRLPSYTDLRVMFSGVGHISNRAKIHVGFVADVLANLMETAIFAYLGLFLFSNKKWDDIPLILIGVFACVISRVIMIGVVSFIVNIGGWIQEYTGKLWNSDASEPMPLEDSQQPRLYIDRHMQLVLLFSGMRGAVSLALAENIPLYDAVTKHGSQFKPALKAMTSSSIIFTVFFFGASTYYTLKKQRDAQRRNEEAQGGSLMTSLMGSHSLDLREGNDRDTPPWVNQTAPDE